MKISVITICYNSESTIEETLKSIESQIIDDFELEYIIIDGASNDSTLSIARRYEHVISKIVSEKDTGIYNALNKGLIHATGDIIGFLNSDDTYSNENSLKEIAQTFLSHKVDGIYGDLNIVSRENPNRVVRKWISGSVSKRSFYLGWMPPHPTFFIKRGFYEKFGGFDEEIYSSADYELMLRFILIGQANMFYLNKILVTMKNGGFSDQSFRHRLVVFNQDRKAWKKNNLGNGYVPVTFKILRKIPQFLNI